VRIGWAPTRSAAIVSVALAGLAWLASGPTEPASDVAVASAIVGAEDHEVDAGQPQVVTVGAVPITVYGVDMPEGTYYGDFYVWYRWKGPIDPVSTTEITNNVERWGTTFTALTEEPELQPGGYFLQQFRLDGRFDNDYTFGRFPLDVEHLYLTFENSTYPADQLVYQAAPPSDLLTEENLQVQGWQVGRWTAHESLHTYNSRHGRPNESSTYSAVSFSLELSRPPSYFIGGLLLPLVVVMMMGLAALLVDGKSTDVRIALPTTAILTAVFLQLAYADGLPSVRGLVLMDLIYVVAFVSLAIVLGRVIYASYETRRTLRPGYSTRRGDLTSLAVLGPTIVIAIIGIVGLTA
jgi:hypothetical protein